MISSWGNHFHQVSWGLDKNCRFFTNGQVLNVSCFFYSDLSTSHKNDFFFQSNADVKSVDHEGRTCISYARNANSQELVDLLLNNGCPDVNLFGSLPKRKNSISVSRKNDFFDKVTSSILWWQKFGKKECFQANL